jgi:ribosomal protein S18 acetylase RimI-like enzyme
MRISIRKAGKNDIDILAEMNREFQISEKKVSDKYKRIESVGALKKRIASQIYNKNFTFLIATYDDGPAGFAKGLIESYPKDYEGLGKIGFVSIIYIRKKFRRKGIGTKLYKMMIREFHKKRIKMIIVFHYASNRPAIGFVKKLGFKVHSLELRKFLFL